MPNPFTTTVSGSSHCCAVYELNGLPYEGDLSTEFISYVLNQAKAKPGAGGHAPLVIMFSDAKEHNRGEALRELLIQNKYKCDKLELGKNPKSSNNVVLYFWFTDKSTARKSVKRKYEYTEGKIQSRASVSGRDKGIGAKTSRTIGGLLRSVRRGRTGL